MNSNEARLFSTLIVWVAITVIAVSLMIFGVQLEGFMAAFMPILLVVAGLSSMRYIWRDSSHEQEVAAVEKAKRKNRIEYLMATLDEAELADLRARLSADGEMLPLNDLLAEYEQSNQRRTG
ncbi:MAG: hypothetical protein H6672_14210 [Anaerolineaceae bacterium]|nr:hypothetical protein [Anaerolineaceae bacterium]